MYSSLSLSLSRSLTQIDSVIPHRTTTAAAAVDARPASASGAAQRVAVGVDVRKHIQKRIMTSVCVCVCVCEGFFIYPYFPSSHASTLPFVLWQRNTDGKKNLKPIPGADSGCGPKTKNTPTYQLQLNYVSLSLSPMQHARRSFIDCRVYMHITYYIQLNTINIVVYSIYEYICYTRTYHMSLEDLSSFPSTYESTYIK